MKFILIAIITITATAQMRYSVPCDSFLLSASEKILYEQVGVLEVGENRGVKVESYQKAVGLKPGQPYCAAGQYYCFSRACEMFDIKNCTIPFPKSGLARSYYNYGRNKGNRTAYKPKIHDLIVWGEPGKSTGHIERIISIGRAGWVKTIGFNTKLNGRQGVNILNRNIANPLGRLTIRGLVGFND